MKKAKIVLFSLRLFLYSSVIFLILIHPGISVSFDFIGITQWFVIIPLLAVIAFLPEGKPFTGGFRLSPRNRFFFAALSLFLLSILAGGFGAGAFQPFFAGFLSFTLTFLMFHYPRWAKISVLEPFFLAWVVLRLLTLSRSGEDIAGQTVQLTQFILVWTAVVFLFHSIVVYFCLFPRSTGGAGKEAALFSLAAGALLVLVVFVMPADFIRNAIIENLLSERMPQRIQDDAEKGIPKEGRREGRRTIPRGENGNQPGLRGISEYNWQNRSGRGRSSDGESDNRQYMVMVVASDREPIYMGDLIRGQLDPIHGFLPSYDEPFNRLASQRFFVSWYSYEPDFDIGRERQEVFSLSTLPQKYLPWRPVTIDPVILSEDTGPLRFIHQVVSNTFVGDPMYLVGVLSRDFYNYEEYELAPYFEITLEKEDLDFFSGWLDSAFETWDRNREDFIRNDRYLWEIFSRVSENADPVNEHLEKIFAIMTAFSRYQYNLDFNDDYSIESLKEFLLSSKDGDCVEFSNSLALLGRLAGIPSRVVTGYLVAEGLQTNAHLRGLAALREKIPVLRQFPFDNLFLVTNLHSHSWTQFYIPDYGWLDFEATTFAIPPVGMGDFNTWDVVIPILDENRVFSNVKKFPWRAVLKTAGILAGLALILAYVLRYGRELALSIGARSGGRRGARSLYLLLLARLAADGKPVKPASKTALEYAEIFPSILGIEQEHLKNFAVLYSELRWREFADKAQVDEHFLKLRQEYKNILKTARRRGILGAFIRVFSLRGLAYL
jgi:transglutaminase-like putative cysteine protease